MSLGFRDPHESTSTAQPGMADARPTTTVVIHLSNPDAEPNRFEFENAFVSDERNPARLLTVKRLDENGKVMATVFIPLEQIGMVQQVEKEADK
jgi:hypothetical protein